MKICSYIELDVELDIMLISSPKLMKDNLKNKEVYYIQLIDEIFKRY